MDIARRSELLKQMLSQVAPEGVVANPGSQLESFGLSEPQADVVKSGIESLSRDLTLERPQADALEAIIHKQFRPAVFIVENTFDTPPAPWEHLGTTPFQQRITQLIPSIGRVELPGMVGVPFGGTGFIVGPNLIMTNRHVAEIFTSGLGTKRLVFKSNRTSAINFRREIRPTPDVQNVSVQRVVMIHPFWDMALLQVDGLVSPQVPLKLSTKHPSELAERDVVVIGYPAQDPRNAIDLQNEIFGGVFNVKRLQPGKLKEVRKIESFGNVVNAVTHDASTLGGNSGSAVIDVETGEVVALHFAGLFLDANFAVPTHELARDSRVVDCGLNFNGSVASTTDWADRWQVADAVSEAVAPRSTMASTNQSVAPQSSQTSPQIQNGAVTWTIPLQVTISFGQPTITPQGGAIAPPSTIQKTEAAGGDEESQVVAAAYQKFSATGLQSGTFSWPIALSTVAASHLAYRDAVAVNQVARNQWSFATCDFVKAQDTEVFVASDANTVLVSFRGTAEASDWIRDFNFFSTSAEYGSVHRGFYFGFQQAKAQIESILAAIGASSKQLVITGHSLGGALATIAAAEWNSKFSIRNVYTFGQPAVGKRDFRDFMNQNFANRFQRFVNDDDIVPRVPPGYVHVGKLFHFGPQATVSNESIAAAIAPETETPMLDEVQFRILQEQCEVVSSAGPQTAAITEGLLPSFSDHKLFRYMAKIMKQIA